MSTSPAINAGSNPGATSVDQRGSGYARVVGIRADIGALEVQTCVNDNDHDGLCDEISNASQSNLDADSLGDACDPCPSDATNTCVSALNDSDNDGIPDDSDNCPAKANPSQANQDSDPFGDSCDNCTDSDADNVGDAGFTNNCASDSDNDNIINIIDNCLALSNASQADSDLDGLGDACDYCPNDSTNNCISQAADLDGDGIPDAWDNCPGVANESQADQDNDSLGDACDNCTDSVEIMSVMRALII